MPPTEEKIGCALRGAPPGESEGGHRPTKGKKMQHNNKALFESRREEGGW